MAECLVGSGHSVRVWNRSPERARPLVEAGCELASTPHDAAASADFAFSMFSNDEASRAIWLGRAGMLAALQPGALAIECSTLSHAWVMELAESATHAGIAYLDCPVTGLPEATSRGDLTLLIGGREEDIARAREVLTPLSGKILRFGSVGAGTAYKLIANLLGAVEIAATAEAMETARRAGLDLTQVAEALAAGTAGSFHVGRQARIMATESHGDHLAFTTDL